MTEHSMSILPGEEHEFVITNRLNRYKGRAWLSAEASSDRDGYDARLILHLIPPTECTPIEQEETMLRKKVEWTLRSGLDGLFTLKQIRDLLETVEGVSGSSFVQVKRYGQVDGGYELIVEAYTSGDGVTGAV